MPALSPTILSELLERAKLEDFGLYIETDNVTALDVNLNIIRKELGWVQDVRICRTPDPNVLYLVRNDVELPL